MAGELGGLSVFLGLDAAKFTRGLTDAENSARRASKAMAFQIGLIAGAAAGVATKIAAAASSLPDFFSRVVSGASALDDFAERTGISVEEASKLAQVMRISGGSIKDLEGPLDKLAKGLTGVDEETKGAGKALQILGVDARDSNGKLKDSGQLLREVAASFAGFEDGAGKSAAAQALFGKSGAALLPTLKDINEAGEINASVSTEQAAQAEALEKASRRLGLALENSVRSVVLDTLPAWGAFKKTLLETGLQMLELSSESSNLGRNIAAQEWAKSVGEAVVYWIIDPVDLASRLFKTVGTSIAYAAASVTSLFSGGGGKGAQALNDAFNEDFKALWDAPTASQKFLKNVEEAQKSVAAAGNQVKKSLEPTQFSAAKSGLEKVKKEANELQQLLSKIYSKDTGTDADFIKNLMLLKASFDQGKLSLEQYNDAATKYVEQQSYMREQAKSLAEDQKEQIESVKQQVDAYNDLTQSLNEQLSRIEFETSIMGLNESARKEAILSRELEQQGIIKGSALWEQYGQKIIDATKVQTMYAEVQEATKKKIQEANDVASEVVDTLANLATGGADAFKRLGEDIQRYLVKQLLEVTLKKWIVDIQVNSSGGGGFGDLFKNLFNLSSGALSGTGGGYTAPDAVPAIANSSADFGTAKLATTGNTYVYNVGSQVSRGEVLTGLQQTKVAAINETQNNRARNTPGFRY